MKNGKKPSREQKLLIGKYRLNVENWLVVKNLPSELLIVHRHTNNLRTLSKERNL